MLPVEEQFGVERLAVRTDISQMPLSPYSDMFFLKRYRNMNQKPTLVKLTQRCVIENTIAKPTIYSLRVEKIGMK